MPLKLCTATPVDAPRIAEIHMLAFGSNKMLRAQFPTPAIRAALQKSIEEKALADIEDPMTSVLIVRELLNEEQEAVKGERGKAGKGGEVVPKEGKVISFAKWGHPIEEGEDYVEPPWAWPEGTNLEVLDAWGEEIDEAHERALGATPCYRLSFIGTDPLYERRGAASLLVQWGIEQCKSDKTPAYLESTLEAGPLYERHGFVAVEKLSLEIEGIEEGEGPEIYEEICFIFRP